MGGYKNLSFGSRNGHIFVTRLRLKSEIESRAQSVKVLWSCAGTEAAFAFADVMCLTWRQHADRIILIREDNMNPEMVHFVHKALDYPFNTLGNNSLSTL